MNPVLPAFTAPSSVELLRDGSAPTTRIHDGTPDFSSVFQDLVLSANQRAVTANDAAQTFAAGARDDIHGTMLALSKADIELRLVGAIRNKVVDAFYELWRMQI